MSLVGFKARNHPQQTLLRGSDDAVDERRTPLALWHPLDAEFGFTLDAAAASDNALCERYFTLEHDGLAQSWASERVWVNPPFSGCADWVLKAWEESAHATIVMLLPANRTEQRWWQEMVEPHRDRYLSSLRTRFLPGRINFASRDNPLGRYKSSAPFGCVLLIWQRPA